MKNLPLLYLGLCLGLVTIQVQAMDDKQVTDSEKQVALSGNQAIDITGLLDDLPDNAFASPKKNTVVSPQKTLAGLLDNLPPDAFDSPKKKSPIKLVKSPIKSGKQEEPSPTKSSPKKLSDMTQTEIDFLTAWGAFDSPEKAVAKTAHSIISPAKTVTVGFPSPEKCFADITDKKLARGTNIIATLFQVPNGMYLNAIAKPDSIIIIDHDGYIKDRSRSPGNQALRKLQERVANLFIAYFKDSSGRSIASHIKTTSWINENGLPRVCGMGSNNLTQQAVKNQEMSLYLKSHEGAQARQAHEAFAKRILPYCKKYSEIMDSPLKMDFSKVIDLSGLPKVPTSHLADKLHIFHSDQENGGPFIEHFLKEMATHVSTYSISDRYLDAVIESKNKCDLIINKECYKNPVIQQALALLALQNRQAAVFTDPAGDLHNKFAIGNGHKVFMGGGNFTETGINRSLNDFVYTINPDIHERCLQAFKKQLAHPETKMVKPNGKLAEKRPLDSNNNNNNNNDGGNSSVKRPAQRSLFNAFNAGNSF